MGRTGGRPRPLPPDPSVPGPPTPTTLTRPSTFRRSGCPHPYNLRRIRVRDLGPIPGYGTRS